MTLSLVSALNRVVAGDDLDTATARAVMDEIFEGVATPAQMGALLAALRLKGETVEELTGMVESMRNHAVPVPLRAPAVDTCGTGGDRAGTFNISTAAALVVAGAGCPVAKHGNRAASSRCGSADVLEALGVAISLPPRACSAASRRRASASCTRPSTTRRCAMSARCARSWASAPSSTSSARWQTPPASATS